MNERGIMQGPRPWIVLVAATAAASGCADGPAPGGSAQREAASAILLAAPDVKPGREQASPSVAQRIVAKRHRHPRAMVPPPGPDRNNDDDTVVVTLTTTISEPPTRHADSGGSTIGPLRPPGQREGVFAPPLGVTSLGDASIF